MLPGSEEREIGTDECNIIVGDPSTKNESKTKKEFIAISKNVTRSVNREALRKKSRDKRSEQQSTVCVKVVSQIIQ